MVSMIRLILILILTLIPLSSCGNLPIAYIQNFSQVNNVIFGFPNYEITKDMYESYDNSFMKIRFGRGPNAILVLAYIEDNVYEWVGSDDVKIFTLNGRIIRTEGLPHNYELRNYSDDDFLANSSYDLINLYNPDLYLAKMERAVLKTNRDKIKKMEKDLFVNKIYEKFKVNSIAWTDTNIYYQNISTSEIERVEQNIHPRLPKVFVEYYLKY